MLSPGKGFDSGLLLQLAPMLSAIYVDGDGSRGEEIAFIGRRWDGRLTVGYVMIRWG